MGETTNLVTEILKQSPVAGAIILVVVIFMRAMAKRDRDFAEREDARDRDRIERQERWLQMWQEMMTTTTGVLSQVRDWMVRDDHRREARRSEKEE